MLHKNTKPTVATADSNTDFFEIVAGVLQRLISTNISRYLFRTRANTSKTEALDG